MRLINTFTFLLEEYFGDQIPKYAILSHTWKDEEVTYQDWQQNPHGSVRKRGFKKIDAACSVARSQSIEYIWVDTNCINKDSSSELSEAINSMFTWYRKSHICYVYLDDFRYEQNSDLDDLKTSRWFTRGWTLQELLAPGYMEFFDASWTQFATKHSLLNEISSITSIQIQYLMEPDTIRTTSIARRMSWAATRSTTREEDMAYCLLGIFEINMPLLYGEGPKAFIRLQEEIIRHSNDQTIFCWSWPTTMNPEEISEWQGCLAPVPFAFYDSGDFIPNSTGEYGVPTDFQLTNSGLRINLPMLNSLRNNTKLAMLKASKSGDDLSQVCLCLELVNGARLARSSFLNRPWSIPKDWAQKDKPCYLAHERDPGRKFSSIVLVRDFAAFSGLQSFAILPTWEEIDYKALIALGNDVSQSLNTYGPVLALNKDIIGNYWYARARFSNSQFHVIDVTVMVRFEEDRKSSWHAEIDIQPRLKSQGGIGQYPIHRLSISERYEFTLNTPSGPSLVRPILIPFP